MRASSVVRRRAGLGARWHPSAGGSPSPTTSSAAVLTGQASMADMSPRPARAALACMRDYRCGWPLLAGGG